ncbi:MAG: SagB/ThcOx family dehydrogenase [Gemmataceae bacterium]|nr:SagB/ThcOx family dehydrogenase [Gemmataceae bacterium]
MDGRLDPTTLPEFLERITAFNEAPAPPEPRSYPGYPRISLPRPRPRWTSSLDHVLSTRRSVRPLGTDPVPPEVLGRVLLFAHGITGEDGRGPAPSSGGLQCLELYLADLAGGWLGHGIHHYDRPGHHLSRLADGGPRAEWLPLVPSLHAVEGGALLWLLAGDAERLSSKYGERAERFLLLEAGHLMQNLCLVSGSLGWPTVPQGGFLERGLARRLVLPPSDRIVYAGVCGRAVS